MSLYKGAEKFKNEVFPAMAEDFSELANGQQPHTLFITCSDSRIDPSLVMQTKPGELFVIRNAGNFVPEPSLGELSVEATVQYAVDVLKVDQIVVCGHSHCGAVTALLNLDSVESMPLIRNWVKRSARVLEKFSDETIDVEKAIDANALLQLEHLRQYECVRNAIAERGMELHAWVYHFETGHVEMLKEKN